MATHYPAAAQHAHPADRFAREILAILERDTMRSRRLMRHMLGQQRRHDHTLPIDLACWKALANKQRNRTLFLATLWSLSGLATVSEMQSSVNAGSALERDHSDTGISGNAYERHLGQRIRASSRLTSQTKMHSDAILGNALRLLHLERHTIVVGH